MNEETKQVKRLYRSRRRRIVAGVAGGMGDYFGIDPVVLRIIWLILLLPGGLPGLVPYLICWIVIPLEPMIYAGVTPTEERIMTLHPGGKRGVNIEKAKYDVVKDAMLEVLSSIDCVSFSDLRTEVQAKLEGKFEGAVGWYLTTVKLDLEARGLVERIPDKRPQMLRMKR